jgi:hypothetical protein
MEIVVGDAFLACRSVTSNVIVEVSTFGASASTLTSLTSLAGTFSSTWAQCYKNFFVRKLRIFVIS